uniref:Ubiquitin carboxyl-terminal hydrolase 47 n=1 Tax=Schizaphis graminum TaxID=13262 RepID=A0A2S2P0F7_SCHGA
MDSPTFEHDPIKVYDQGRSEENWDGTEDDDDDNEFQSNEKYFFKTTKLSDKTSEDDDEKLYAYVDKRMTVKELKTQLVPYINIPSDFIILNRCKSETELEELALPSSSLEDLAYSDTIKITMGQALHDGEYRGIIYWIEPQEQTQILFKKMFDWIIKKGTSVLETKKELLVKLNNTHNIDIPLNRCRLRKKKRDSLMRCYFNEEIWNEDIGQGWEMVILDLKDRSELELNKTKRLMFVNHIEEATPRVISEMEFVVDIASTTSPNTQLGTEISKKLNIPEDQLEMGYMHGHSTEITWKTSVFNWSFSLSDDNIILYCRNADNTSNKETPSKWRRQRKERSLRIHTMNND